MKYEYSNTKHIILAGVSVFLAEPVFSQGGQSKLEEVVVTSQFRQAGLHDVPISVATVDAESIAENNLFKVEYLTAFVPNLTYAETGISTTFYLRGIGSGINQGFEQSVGVYVDGVNFPRAQQVRTPFLDVARVEVLRGPQSIFFGKNAVAGAIGVYSAKPTDNFEGHILTSYEVEDSESLTEMVLSGSLSERVRARLAARYRDADGYIENITLNRSEPQREEKSLRGTFEVDVTENVLATFKAEFSEFDTIGRNIELNAVEPATAGPFAGFTYPQVLVNVFAQDVSVFDASIDGRRSSNGDSSNNKTENYQMTLDWKLGDFDLQAITNYQNLEYDEICDCDFTGASIFFVDIEEEYSQFSQEVRIKSPEGEKFDYVTGVYFQSSDHQYSDTVAISANSILVPAVNLGIPGANFGTLLSGTQATRLAEVDASVWSVFAQTNWHITEEVTLQIGGRLTNDNRDGQRSITVEAEGGGALSATQVTAPIPHALVFGTSTTNLANLGSLIATLDPQSQQAIANLGEGSVDGELDETVFSPDIKFIWDVNDDTLLYTSFSKGNKAGGFDFRANNRGVSRTSAEAFIFDDEKVSNYEVGGRFKFSETAELNVTAFFTELDDLQTSVFDGILGFNVGNAASAEVTGLEVDGRWAVTNHFRLSGGVAVTDFEFTDYENGQCYFGRTSDFANGLCDFTGESNTLVSDFTMNITADFDMPINNGYKLTSLFHVFYVDDYNASVTYDPLGEQDAYTKLNLRLGMSPQDKAWEVALVGKNLTDEEVSTLVGDAPLAGDSFATKAIYQFVGQGRTLALQFRVNF